jgi:hypothetical protein
MPLSERKAFAQSQGGQPGWLKSSILFAVIKLAYQTASSPVVRLRLGMDQYFEQLRYLLLKTDLKRGRKLMHLMQRKIVRHGAVAG